MRHKIRFCTTRDGVRLAYSVAGQGPALFVVKSFWGHVENDWNCPIWGHWMRELSARHCLVRYDCRGTGLSDRNLEDQSFETLVNDALTVIDHAGLKQFVLVALTGGAPIALTLAARRPELVSRMVIHAGYVRGRFHGEEAWRVLGESFIELARIGWDEPVSVARQMLASSFIPDAPTDVQEAFDRCAREYAGGADAARVIRTNYEVDVTAEAALVRCPVLNLQPVHNNLLVPAPGANPLEEGRRLTGLVPGARLVALDSRNHILLAHEPAWARWCEEFREFLDEPGDDPSTFSDLSTRELELTRLLAAGLDNAQIAAHLAIAEKTVRNHITRIFAKLNVTTRAQAIVLAHRSGLSGARSVVSK